jgi:tetratricopeptide (TPR) repeat protein
MRWANAATEYEVAGSDALKQGEIARAWTGWRLAGECWRRADRPLLARERLVSALGLVESGGEPEVSTVVPLSAVLADLGEAEAALEHLEAVDLERCSAEVRDAVLDARVGALLGLGRKEEARSFWRTWVPAEGPATWAHRYRELQLMTLDGDLLPARLGFQTLAGACRGRAERTAEAAAWMGLADVEYLLGHWREAVKASGTAAEAWRAAGRRAPAMEADLSAVVASAGAGAHPLATVVESTLDYAQERQLMALAVQSYIVRGMIMAKDSPREADRDFARAMDAGMRSGLPVWVGRAAVERVTRIGPARDLLDLATMAFVSHVPWAARTALLKARALVDEDPAVSRAIAKKCVTELERMGMSRDLGAARTLARSLE